MPISLPSPTHSFTIPSVYDGIQLACRIYLPQELLDTHASSRSRVRGAIVAHPYASLGGCYDDPVVSFIGGELLDAGYVVGTFNFRGAGDSEGRTSWTARPELADYVSFYGFMMLYLQLLRLRLISRSENKSAVLSDGIQIILGGYSYGSLVASHLPASKVIADLFRDSPPDSLFHEIFLTAKSLCTPEQLPSIAQNANDVLKSSEANISYLLVSPLLPPINMFLTLFSDLSLEVETQVSGERRQIPCPKPTDQLCAYRTLAIYGDDDTFTSVSKLRKWSDELRSVPHSQFSSREIGGAGHFWREDGAEPQARHALRRWLHEQH